jgi:hypothetical protein
MCASAHVATAAANVRASACRYAASALVLLG